MFFKRREQQRSNRARRAKGKTSDGHQQSSSRELGALETSRENNILVNKSHMVANPAGTEGKRPKTDFSNILNSTANEGGNGFELYPQIKIAPITNPVALDPKQSFEKVRVAEKSLDIEFLEAREVECPDCDKRFAARAKLLGHLVSIHYAEKIFNLYPFNKGSLCPLCIDSGETFARLKYF